MHITLLNIILIAFFFILSKMQGYSFLSTSFQFFQGEIGLEPIFECGAMQNAPWHQNLGWSVGGTNPSLVEALGAGSPVLAHDNKFNRYTNEAVNLLLERLSGKVLLGKVLLVQLLDVMLLQRMDVM